MFIYDNTSFAFDTCNFYGVFLAPLTAAARRGRRRARAPAKQGFNNHLVDNAPSVGVLRCSKKPVYARDKIIQQRAKSLSLAGA